ncbi:alpha/beta fold hydrolase [Sediminitomix flava]|uniref:Pimeloyl-ACP methyl ester carboxylesterase n=1 Tax=Sediminitomix flava TaxID=379075 RepID=A0A315Z7I3_SEDFL|nr:alpha/beta hydrolase [Sediminitomix flava]PWJ40881.1 pimeloyl-ACP methyl ester carboxylesterase [Sediminitomix flava]
MKKIISALVSLFLFTFNLNAQSSDAFKVEVTGKGPSFFLIPGASCGSNVYNQFVEDHQDKFQFHKITLAGYAGNPALEGDTFLPNVTSAISAYIKQHKTDNSILMGHSIGGFISLLLNQNEALIKRVIIIDTLPFLPASINPLATEDNMKAFIHQFVPDYTKMKNADFEAQLIQNLKGMVKSESHIDFIMEEAQHTDKKTMTVSMRELMTTDLRNKLNNIKSEVLVLYPWDSDLSKIYPNFTKERISTVYQTQYSGIENIQLEMIEDARHFLMLDQAEVFSKKVNQFLNKPIAVK